LRVKPRKWGTRSSSRENQEGACTVTPPGGIVLSARRRLGQDQWIALFGGLRGKWVVMD